ncbi:hypothetical protein UFOVP75_200 [uncultured Caudovirales phage]|uniref:Uncharacterized protein n=1 Tax=uncultured Caudovirales phage TaxID=2100421 RepID=A0A6J5L1D9_9CAUD|nr:hypothetical protein UFOVP75_200 [uncultured Caudovirales phage]
MNIRVNFDLGRTCGSYRERLYGFLMNEGEDCYLTLEGHTRRIHENTLRWFGIPLDSTVHNEDIHWSQTKFSHRLLHTVLDNLGKLHDLQL